MSFTTFPTNTIVYIHEILAGVAYQASGVLIAPDEVLTASHVVYSSTYGIATSIQVAPGYDARSSLSSTIVPYGFGVGVAVHYNPVEAIGGVVSLDAAQNDYAVIHLAKPFRGLPVMTLQAGYAGGEANVSGYPYYAAGVQHTDAEFVTPDTSRALLDGIDPGAGADGGPVWIEAPGGPAIVGVVSTSDASIGRGYIAPITEASLDAIDAWVAQDDPPCFLRGTAIATLRGDVPVEQLTTEDMVRARFAGTARVRWLGHRLVDCRRHPRPHDVWPVCVRAGAFGAGRPRRDLLLSPDHAVLVGSVLIPVRLLVNGASIAQQEHSFAEYWHVELARHDVLLAEGLPAESFLDTGNRGAFANGGGAVRLHPDFARGVWQAAGCAPLVLDGRRLAAARRRVLSRAGVIGHGATDDPALTILADDRFVAAETDGRGWWVRLPAGARRVRLLSRTWVPAQMRATETDTRRLGVAVGRMWLDGWEVGLDSPGLVRGWHAPEPTLRWTDGDGELLIAGMRGLSFEIERSGRYWLSAATPVSRVA